MIRVERRAEIEKEAEIAVEIAEKAEDIEAILRAAGPDHTPNPRANQRKSPNPIRSPFRNPTPSRNPGKGKSPNLLDPGKI